MADVYIRLQHWGPNGNFTLMEGTFMRPFFLAVVLAAVIAIWASMGAQDAPTAGPYKVLKTAKVGGEGGFDYISAGTSKAAVCTSLGADQWGD